MSHRDNPAQLLTFTQNARLDADVLDALISKGYDTPSTLDDAMRTDDDGSGASRGITTENIERTPLAGKMRCLLRDLRNLAVAGTPRSRPN